MSTRTVKHWLVKRAAWVAGLALLAAISYFGAGHWHPSDKQFPAQGIDASHLQGEIHWPSARADGVDFAYIEATKGVNFRDPLFALNWQATHDAGVPRGAYHFFVLCRPATEQATNFIATVPREKKALSPVVKLDFRENCAERPERGKLIREVVTFLEMIEAHSGKPAIVYVTREFDKAYQISGAFRRALWLRNLFFEPRYGGGRWAIWQASNMRNVDGIEGRVEWNVVR